MTQLRRMPAIAVVCALSIIAAIGSASAALVNDAALICAQTPSSAALDSSNVTITPDDPVGADDCVDLCKKWVATCKGAVAAMKACWTKAVSRVAALRNATCRTDPATAEACKDVVVTEKEQAKTNIDSDAELSRTFCEGGGFATCIAQCS